MNQSLRAGIAGIILMGVAVFLAAGTYAFKTRAATVAAAVTAVTKNPHSKGWTVSAEYAMENKKYIHSFRTNKAYLYREGDSFELLCDPLDPRKAKKNDFQSLWLLPAISAFMGIVIPICVRGVSMHCAL